MSDSDRNLSEARRHVAPYREQLADLGIHPDRFAQYLSTWPPDKHVMVLGMTTGEVSGLHGAEPGTREHELLMAVRMSDQERAEHERSKRRRP